jgi:hypothetical protein
MNRIRTRAAVVLASSAVLAGGFGLTAVAVSSAASAPTPLAASGQAASIPCPNTTLIEACVTN